MKRATLVLAALALLLGGVGRARAGSIILYNNLPPAATNNHADAVFTFGPLADSFSTGGSAVNLSDVKLLLETGTPTGSITVTLRSDSSTSPGAVLTTIGTLNDTSLTPTRIRSRPEGDKRIVRESHGERQERRYLVGNNQEETWRVFLYWFQTFREPTFRQGEQVS